MQIARHPIAYHLPPERVTKSMDTSDVEWSVTRKRMREWVAPTSSFN